jgi:hypothetical protein
MADTAAASSGGEGGSATAASAMPTGQLAACAAWRSSGASPGLLGPATQIGPAAEHSCIRHYRLQREQRHHQPQAGGVAGEGSERTAHDRRLF